MEPEAEVVQASEPKAVEPSLPERLAKFVEEQWQGAAPDSATVEPSSAEEPQTNAEPDGVETLAAETNQPAQDPTPGDDIPYAPEQLRDSAFWGGLDKDGWAKAERLHPVETKLVKAAQAAASRIVNAARKETPATTPPPVSQDAEPEAVDPKLQELLDTLDVGTPAERVAALRQLVGQAVGDVPEVRATREKERHAAVLREAYDLAVLGDDELGLPAMPELDQLSEAELSAAYEGDPEAKALTKIGTPAAIALAMRRSGQTALAQKRAATEKFDREQAKIQRNANTPVSNAVKPGAAGPIQQKPASIQEFVMGKWSEAVARSRA